MGADSENRLAEAQAAVSLKRDHVESQRQMLSELERDGHRDAASRARVLLRALEHDLQLLMEDRDSIKKQFEQDRPDEDTSPISDEAAVPEMPEGVSKDYDGSPM